MDQNALNWFLAIVIAGNFQLPVVAGSRLVPSGQRRGDKRLQPLIIAWSYPPVLRKKKLLVTVRTKQGLRGELIFQSTTKRACRPFGERGEMETRVC